MIKSLFTKIKERWKPNILAVSIGVVYLWFGSLKFFPHLSPAEGLAKNTIHQLTLGILPDSVSIILLALLEVGIGLLLLLGIWRKFTVIVALGHMALTFTPMLFFPLESFQQPPFVPTLLGQYIGKNLVIVAALLSLPQSGRILKFRIRNKS